MKTWSKLKTLFRRRKAEAEMSAEIRLHLELQTERNIAAGLDPNEARYAAQRAFGGVEQVKERCREQRSLGWLEYLVRDVRLAARSLRRAPLFSAAVIATLALCIGPNTAILTLLYALVLKPAPFPQPERLVQVYNAFEKLGGERSRQASSVPQYRDFQANADLFEGFAIMRYAGTTLDDETMPQRVMGMRVNAGFFDLLGVRPLLGRFGMPEEDAIGADHVLVLTRTFWESHFNADPNVIGRVVRLGGEPWTIIGVAPRSVEVLDRYTQFFKPFEPLPNEVDPRARYAGRVLVFGRLKPDVTRSAAVAQLRTIDGRYLDEQAAPATRSYFETAGHRVVIESLGAQTADAVSRPLTLLQVGAGFVLLIGVVNVLNLMLARVNAKRPELAIRHALGAGRATLLRQLLAESLLLTAAATVVGAGLAWAAVRVINGYLPMFAGSAAPVQLEPAMVGLAAVVAFALAGVMGVLPFALLWKRGLKLNEIRTASAGAGVRVFGGTLVVAQVAIALLLLVGAGLLGRSLARVLATDPGFETANLVQGRVAVPKPYESPQANVALQRRIVDGLREIPGVEGAALVFDYALSGSFRAQPFVIRGEAAKPGANRPLVAIDPVSPEFFDTLRITLLEGRGFTYADDVRGSAVLVVDDLFAKRYFPGRSAVGREVALSVQPPPDGQPWPRIIGVVRRPQLTGLEGRDGMPIVFVPMVQQPAGGFSFVVRSARDTGDLIAEIRRKLRSIEPTLPLYGTATIDEGLASMMMGRRGMTLLIAAFSGLALMLAGVGLYGVLAYDVSQRTREIGIRGAIGATRGQIVAMVLRQGMVKTALGVGAGLAGAVYLTRFLRGLLFDVERFDPVAFVGVSLLMLAVAALACWLPARRAAKVDPIVALRCE
ncbi:ABC transporter permease [Opitutus terrae]|uniref:Permease n=1 Tax=Opitutus terrae (strain DSM 11246 / JCM 15787 / PB90-1) TaxID=452637 RepID=B1ZMY4_OPITP|nr:ABC transporter permease [Opitutus terrae]ACB76436.1 permease [Opitutus terrae PB90-1]